MAKNIQYFEVFHGTMMDSNLINKLLLENGIETQVKNQIQNPKSVQMLETEGADAEVVILVKGKDFEKAAKLVTNHLR